MVQITRNVTELLNFDIDKQQDVLNNDIGEARKVMSVDNILECEKEELPEITYYRLQCLARTHDFLLPVLPSQTDLETFPDLPSLVHRLADVIASGSDHWLRNLTRIKEMSFVEKKANTDSLTIPEATSIRGSRIHAKIVKEIDALKFHFELDKELPAYAKESSQKLRVEVEAKLEKLKRLEKRFRKYTTKSAAIKDVKTFSKQLQNQAKVSHSFSMEASEILRDKQTSELHFGQILNLNLIPYGPEIEGIDLSRQSGRHLLNMGIVLLSRSDLESVGISFPTESPSRLFVLSYPLNEDDLSIFKHHPFLEAVAIIQTDQGIDDAGQTIIKPCSLNNDPGRMPFFNGICLIASLQSPAALHDFFLPSVEQKCWIPARLAVWRACFVLFLFSKFDS